MVFEIEYFVFEKAANSNEVFVSYTDDKDNVLFSFIDNSIGDDFNRFTEACKKHF